MKIVNLEITIITEATQNICYKNIPWIKIRPGVDLQLAILEVEWAQFFQALAELELGVSSEDKPEPVKISLVPASSPSFY